MSIIKNNKNYGTRVILLGEPPVPPVPPTPTDDYFYVEDVSGAANTLSIKKNTANAPTVEVFYSTDQQNWSSMGTTSTTAITATIPANGKLYLKASADKWSYFGQSNRFSNASGNINVGGNIMSLLYGDNFTGKTEFPSGSDYNFSGLFMNNTKVINASELELPATTLATNCYQYMFQGCTSLISAPALPATTLDSYCYEYMFQGCTSLTTAPATLPATTLATNCYDSMFDGCTALTTAPALPATTLGKYCYQYMFYGCTSLAKVTTYAQDISASSCLYNWLGNVAATGDFYNLGGATYTSGASGIPSGWTEHNSL